MAGINPADFQDPYAYEQAKRMQIARLHNDNPDGQAPVSRGRSETPLVRPPEDYKKTGQRMVQSAIVAAARLSETSQVDVYLAPKPRPETRLFRSLILGEKTREVAKSEAPDKFAEGWALIEATYLSGWQSVYVRNDDNYETPVYGHVGVMLKDDGKILAYRKHSSSDQGNGITKIHVKDDFETWPMSGATPYWWIKADEYSDSMFQYPKTYGLKPENEYRDFPGRKVTRLSIQDVGNAIVRISPQ